MDTENINMKGKLKLYDILATFSDSTYMKGCVQGYNDTSAYKNFIALPEMAAALNDPKKHLLQCTISERDDDTE